MVRDLNHFDVAIVGGGLAGMMRADVLADALANDPSLDLRVAIIDPEPDALRRKTFAAWRLKSSLPHRYSVCVENRWDRFRIVSADGSNVVEKPFDPYCYERIPGDRIFAHIDARLRADKRFVRIVDRVVGIHESFAGSAGEGRASIRLASGQCVTATRVLSSVTRGNPEVLQYFLGFEIETTSDYFDSNIVDLMDFRVPQEGDVRFVYILPFSRRRALVEFTVFSPNRMADEACEKILRHYIASRLELPAFKILSVESGAIPMSVSTEPAFPARDPGSMIDVIGGAGGMVKPSTGYSFQRNMEALVDQALVDQALFNQAPRRRPDSSYSRYRFQVYDALLLRIIQANGGMISRIFPLLFSRNTPEEIFSFLDEKSRFPGEIRIFYRLPWAPFLSSLVVLYPFFFAACATIVLHLTVGGAAVWLIPLVGLLTAGIGHGSLDHLLDPASAGRPLIFYARYLGSMVLFLAAWYLFPPLALAFFLFQSADHFGEAQWIRSIRFSTGSLNVRILAWVWGLFAALFGVLMHWHEALPVVQMILRESLPVGLISDGSARAAGAVLFAAALACSLTLDRYERKVVARPVSGFPATVFLGTCIAILPLLPGFFCFFAFWHAWDSIIAQRAVKGWTSASYARKAIRYTVASWTGIFLGIVAFTAWGDPNRAWQVLFLSIGALTAAHAPVMKSFLLGNITKKNRPAL
ncbi:hypothetical protein EBZ80_18085 [bacterium]|nr:hypothetical protein [bacterium]